MNLQVERGERRVLGYGVYRVYRLGVKFRGLAFGVRGFWGGGRVLGIQLRVGLQGLGFVGCL